MRPTALRPRAPRADTGFTLIEMMTVVALLAIISAIAVPSFRSFLDGQRVKGIAYDLTADLLLARSEALKRNANVAIARGGNSWTDGWASAVAGTSTQISARGPSSGDIVVSGAPSSITFDANGRVSAPSAEVRITVSTGATSRCIELSPSGRARSLVGACT
jgi:type IV fimbrial biogenesis protein FimT